MNRRRVILPLCLLLPVSFALTAAAGQEIKPAPAPAPSPACAELPVYKERLARADATLRDWAQLGRYAAANEKVKQSPADPKRVVFLGDSITDFWGLKGASNGFIPGTLYINRGISGQTTPQMLVRVRPDVLDLNPRVVIILAGTNDLSGNTGPMTIQQTEENLESMCELARAHGIRVILCSILPVNDYSLDRTGKPIIVTKGRPPEKIRAINDWMKSYATANNFIYLDYFKAMADANGMLKKEFSDDGLHPNVRGYEAMTPLVEAAITQVPGR